MYQKSTDWDSSCIGGVMEGIPSMSHFGIDLSSLQNNIGRVFHDGETKIDWAKEQIDRILLCKRDSSDFVLFSDTRAGGLLFEHPVTGSPSPSPPPPLTTTTTTTGGIKIRIYYVRIRFAPAQPCPLLPLQLKLLAKVLLFFLCFLYFGHYRTF